MQAPTTTRGAQPAAGHAFDVELWLHLVFRQKWKILGGALLGLIAAGVVGYRIKPLYTSQAMLLVRYVLDAPPINPDGDPQNFRPPTQTSEQILNSESMILQSGDSMAKVVQTITARRILAGASGNDDPAEAARYLFANLSVEIPKRSDVIKVSLSHPDPAVARDAVSELVRLYLDKHVEIHGVGVSEPWINARREEARGKLIAAETELGNEKNRVGINTETFQEHRIFVQDKVKLLENQIREKRLDLLGLQGKLAHFAVASSGQATATNSPLSEVEREQVEIYKGLIEQIAYWKQERSALKSRFTDTHPRVRAADEDIKVNEQQKKQMERDYPFLAGLRLEPSIQSSATPRDLTADQASVAQLTATLAQLQSEYTNTLAAAENLRRSESRIVGLEREVSAYKNQLESFEKLLARSTLEQNLGSGFSKIEIFQNATPPVKDANKRLKLMAVALGLGVALGIGVALFSELVLDQTIKRPSVLENQFNIPHFVTLPRSRRLLSREPVPVGGKRLHLTDANGETNGAAMRTGRHDSTGPEETSELQPYFSGLRDRTIMFLERMTHKPKLIAVTGCNKGAGTTTIATGLAQALSETAEGRVLVVDMNNGARQAGQYANGKAVCGITDALSAGTRDAAMVQENLYVASAFTENGSEIPMLPKRFSSIVPQLKTSDFDYVIFDMPPVSSTSVTPRLAGLMDVVLLAVESEKTHSSALRRAINTLEQSRANVATVLNKHQNYCPKWLGQEP